MADAPEPTARRRRGRDGDDAAKSTSDKAAAPETPATPPGQAIAATDPEQPGAETAPAGVVTAPQSRAAAGAFGVSGSGDTSGFGGLVRPSGGGVPLVSSPRPYGGYFDDLVDALHVAYADLDQAIIATVVDRGELTLYIKREHLLEMCRTLRDDPSLRFELCSSVSGVDYYDPEAESSPNPFARLRLHSVYHLTSMTFRRRIRLEVSVSTEDPHIPSVVEVYPTADWQERETWDLFGIVYDGHPALTRILMPDDWDGHPQRKDYPLGGIAVEYKGAEIPPPDERRAYR